MSLPERHEHTPPVGVKWHEYANVFPMLYGPALDALREDIRANGVREPIVFLGDHVLDGRNRYQCARDLGIEYPRREFGSQESDGADPLAFVISHNLTRRHLTESQRASAAARIANMRQGERTDIQPSANLQKVSVSDAARMLNVSERSVASAKAVQDTAPRIAPFVDDGSLSVSLASKVARLPEDAQDEIADAPPDDRRERARVFVQHNTGNNEWYTPPQFLEAARSVLGGFDLDPASSEIANRAVRATTYYTESENGLDKDWCGRIWMNPPYAANLVGKFCDKFAEAMADPDTTGIVLVNNASETGWWQTLASVSSAICFPKGRVKFLRPEGEAGAPLQGQTIFYAGRDPEAFRAEFSPFGFVVLCHE